MSASLEADADDDGFGDETQDAAPAIPPSAQAPCDRLAPDTTIGAGPKDKTKKKQATFEFSGVDARALAGFECSLDDGPFASCTSPYTVKVKKGKHVFSVRAIDAAGNVDASPASDAWKVKKKRVRGGACTEDEFFRAARSRLATRRLRRDESPRRHG